MRKGCGCLPAEWRKFLAVRLYTDAVCRQRLLLVILPDADPPGRKHAKRVAQDCFDYRTKTGCGQPGSIMKLLDLPGIAQAATLSIG